MGLTIQTAATEDPLRIIDLKQYMREDDDDENPVIQRLVKAANEWWTDFTGQQLINQTYDETFDRFRDCMVLCRHPVSSITQVTYIDSDGASQTLSSSVYASKLTQSPGRIEQAYDQTWPATRYISDAVTVRYVAGYGSDYTSVPEDIRHALEQLVLWWYDNRDGSDIPAGIYGKAWHHRILETA